MELLSKIASIIQDRLKVPYSEFFTGKDKTSNMARQILCYVAMTTYKGKLPDLARFLGKTQSACFKAKTTACCHIQTDPNFRIVVNSIIDEVANNKTEADRRLKAPVKKRSFVKKRRYPKPNPFLISYTEEEKNRMLEMMYASALYMEEYCNGVQPLIDGCPISRKEKNISKRRSWYHDN